MVMQAILALLFSVVVSFESMPLKFRLIIGLVGFAGVFVGMVYDQYFRQEESADAKQSKTSSAWPPLSIGRTRTLSNIIVVVSMIGTGIGYAVGGLAWLGSISPGLMTLQVYIFAMAGPWIATLLLLGYTLGRDVVLSDAPFWSKAFPCVGVVLGGVALLSVPFFRESLNITSWGDAAAWTKAAFFFSVAPMWFMPVPVALAIRRRAASAEL